MEFLFVILFGCKVSFLISVHEEIFKMFMKNVYNERMMCEFQLFCIQISSCNCIFP